MNNVNRPIELYFNRGLYPYDCTFNLKNDFILCGNVYDKNGMKNINKNNDHYIWTYSTQTEIWMCKGIYKIPRDFELISISKYDKLYLLSNNYLYEWNILTENTIRGILVNEEENEKTEEKEKNAGNKEYEDNEDEKEVKEMKEVEVDEVLDEVDEIEENEVIKYKFVV